MHVSQHTQPGAAHRGLHNVNGYHSLMSNVEVTNPSTEPPFAHENAFDADVVFLPMRLEGQEGVYPERAVGFFKDINQEGLAARWLHDADQRLWYGERTGVLEVVVIPLILGIGSNAGWAAVVHLLSRKRARVKLEIGHRSSRHGDQERWLRVEGDSSEVANVLERLNPWGNSSPSSESDEQ
jgi:hypothetical protein